MTNENRALFDDYLEYEKLKGRTTQGFINIRTRVPHFIEYLETHELSVTDVRVKDAAGYQGWLLQKKYGNATVCSYLFPASSFCEYARRKGLLAENPFTMIRKVKTEKRVPRNIPKESQMERLLDQLAAFDAKGGMRAARNAYRVHVIAELMYATGMRVSEVAGMKMDDIDFGRGIVYVNCGKGGESRIAWLGDYARAVLRLYVTRMRTLLENRWNERNDELVFGVQWGYFGKFVNERIRKAAKKFSIPGFTSHGFRHAVGYHLLRAGCNIRYIQEILGHKRLANTEIYTKVDRGDLRSVLDRCHPRKWAARTNA